MHIAFLLTQSLESPSGLGRYWPVARELTRLGYQVTILALHPAYDYLNRRRFDRDGVHIRYVAQMHVRKSGSSKTYFGPVKLLLVTALATWRLCAAALRTPADAYHVCKPHPMNGTAGLIASRLRQKPLYLDRDDYEAASNRFGSGWQRYVVAYFEDRLPRRAAGITVNTRFMEQRLQSLGIQAERIVYVPNGVERERFADSVKIAETGARLRQELDLVNRPVVLYVGSMSLASHAVDLLLKAFRLVVAQLPRAVLILVGGGEDLECLRQKCQDLAIEQNVRFVGRVPPNTVATYYWLADVSVDPARDDPASQARSPLKLFESWAMGVPIVTVDVGDRRELLGDPPAGGLSSNDSAEALAERIVAVLQDPHVADTYRKLAQARVQEAYWDRRVLLFESVYQNTE